MQIINLPEVAVEDANHPNPYMFAGVRYDIEIGLYYNRARYYNPFMGRFLQADPVGYEADMNLYRYCRNNPLNYVDPFGREPNGPNDMCDTCPLFDQNEPNKSSDPNKQHKYRYTWNASASTRERCGCWAIKIGATIAPGVSGYEAAKALEEAWCIGKGKKCKEWCENDDNVDDDEAVCWAKCEEEFNKCFERAAESRCKLKFKIQFD